MLWPPITNSANKGEVCPGWHGGPTIAESKVPFWIGFKGLQVSDDTFIDKVLGKKVGQAQPRLSHVAPVVEGLFEEVGR